MDAAVKHRPHGPVCDTCLDEAGRVVLAVASPSGRGRRLPGRCEVTRTEYTALVRRWDGNLDVYVLDTVDGLLGRVQAATMAEVEPMVREYLAARFTRPAGDFHVVIIGG